MPERRLNMIGNIGPLEIAIVVVIALVVFGPKRLPELGNGLGRGMREFKESITGEKEDVKAIGTTQAAAAPTAEPELRRNDKLG
jgi:sec-independent protein translocase protein TatA